MLLSIFMSSDPLAIKLLYLLISIAALVPALVLHEWAHGFAAYKLGDYTAKADGRLSLNPLRHLDPIGSLMLLVVGFGWAKPVPVVTRNFKNPKRDFAITSAAGPAMNFIVAFLSAFLYALTAFVAVKLGAAGTVTASVLSTMFYYLMALNIGLGLFNLIPVPPLDGSNILMCLLPNRYAAKYSRLRFYSQYIFLALIIISRLPVLSGIYDMLFYPLIWLRETLITSFTNFWLMIFGF